MVTFIEIGKEVEGSSLEVGKGIMKSRISIAELPISHMEVLSQWLI